MKFIFCESRMVLIYILSILSLSSLFMDKIQPVQISQVEENNMIKVKTIKSQNTNQKIPETWIEENNILDTNLENSEISNTENNEDEYEEIIFNDDFDKEYRSGTENNYLED